MMNKAVEAGHLFFRGLETRNMSPPEAKLYRLKIEREELLRKAKAYALALNQIERYRDESHARLESKARRAGKGLHDDGQYRTRLRRQAAAYQREMAKLNADHPLGSCAEELRACNIKIAAAVTALHRSWLDDRKSGERFSTFKINSGGVN
jgi:hypothetical protein